MNITIFGATGGIGQLTAQFAKEAGHTVLTADITESQLATDLKGQLTDKEFIKKAIKDSEIIVAAIGPQLNTEKNLTGQTPIADGLEVLMGVMQELNKKRLILLGTPSIAANEMEREHETIIITNKMAADYFPNAYVDIKKVEGLVKSSSFDWTVVRYSNPTAETDGDGLGYSLDINQHKPDVSRSNIAKFIVQEGLKEDYIKKMPLVFNN